MDYGFQLEKMLGKLFQVLCVLCVLQWFVLPSNSFDVIRAFGVQMRVTSQYFSTIKTKCQQNPTAILSYYSPFQ